MRSAYSILCMAVTLLWLTLSGCVSGQRGEPWTIRCIELRGPEAPRHVEHLAGALKQTKDIRRSDVFVAHDLDGFSRLYYGIYHRRTDRATGKRSIPSAMRRDMEIIKELADDSGRRYFLQAMVVPKPLPDVGNPAWALSKADGVYSLQVAAFVPSDDFTDYKRAAAEYCAYLRKQGYEAYFHHGSSCSMVTVGTFGPEAVIAKNVPLTDRKGRSGRPEKCGVAVETHYSQEVLALQRNELFKYNYVNGTLLRTRYGKRLGSPPSSQLVRIPKPGNEESW